MLDSQSRTLLRHLQNDPECPVAELANRAGMTPVTAARRLEKLTEQRILKGQHAVIDWSALGYSVEVSLRFTLDKTASRAFDEFLGKARKIPEVIEIQTFLGRVDVRLSVIARDMAHYQEIYRSRILMLPHIAELEALMHIASIKTAKALPL
ncbi:MAG: AsnC family transcriptional regulator [Marinosulfonomonas sp.]|nr:MAG: AsnC family transcriptional regulator [Marinosulfonomonas sp.]